MNDVLARLFRSGDWLYEPSLILDYDDDTLDESVGISPETAEHLLDEGLVYMQVVVQFRPAVGQDHEMVSHVVDAMEDR